MTNSVTTLFSKSWDLFTANFKQVTALSAIYTLIIFFSETIQILIDRFILDSISMTVLIALWILVLAVSYFGVRTYITLVLVVTDRINSREANVLRSFKQSADLFWSYFLTALKLGFIIILSVIPVVLIYVVDIDPIIQRSLAVLSIVVALYLVVRFGLSLFVSVIHPDADRYFEKSAELFDRNKGLVIASFCLIAFMIGANIYIANLVASMMTVTVLVWLGLLLSLIVNVFFIALTAIYMTYLYAHLCKEKYNLDSINEAYNRRELDVE